MIVSEQTGHISVAYRGTLKQNLDEGALRSELSRIFRLRAEDEVIEAAGPHISNEPSAGEPREKAAG